MSTETFVTRSIENARKAGNKSIMIDFGDDGAVFIQGDKGFWATKGYRPEPA